MTLRRWMALASALGLAAIFFFTPFLDRIRYWRFHYLADRYYQQGQLDQASFYASLIWMQNPRDDRALQILAEATRPHGGREALWWASRLAGSNPRDPRRLLDLAELVLGSGQAAAAEKILSTAAALPGVDSERLQELQADTAIVLHRRREAEIIYRRLAAAHPERPQLIYNLANLLAASTQARDQAEGRSLLLQLWDKKQLPLETSRSLIALSLKDKKAGETLPWVRFLATAPGATLDDLLLCGHATLESGGTLDSDWRKKTAGLARSGEDVYKTITWFRRHRLQEEALAWCGSLPEMSQLWLLTRVGRTEVLADLGRWEDITTRLQQEDWGNGNHFRRAFLLQSLRRPADHNHSSAVDDVLWRQMITSLAKFPGDVFRLERLFQSWNWPSADFEKLLADLAERPQITEKTLHILITEAQREHDTLALYVFARHLLRLHPDDLVAGNNTALYGLLLRKEIPTWTSQAEKLFHEHPDNPAVLTTWAFALHCNGLDGEALGLFAGLSADTLHRPDIALYYGVLLNAAGKKEEAQPFLKIAATAPMLPEESALLSAAQPQ